MFDDLTKKENSQELKNEPILPTPPPLPPQPTESLFQRMARLKDEVQASGSKNKLYLVIGIIVILLFIGGAVGAVYYLSVKNKKADSGANQIVCTQEAKLCPDGSSVGRTGPNCEFAGCPVVKSCAKEGEQFSQVYKDKYSEHCCEGLKEWASGMDTRKVENGVCMETGMVAGSPVGTCIKCGDGVCGQNENICNCPEDCKEIDIFDWQTYKNEKYGFEFKYPKRLAIYGDFLVEVIDKGEGMFNTFGRYGDISNIKSHSFDIDIKDAPAEGFIMHIDITSNPLILSYLKGQINELSNTKTINGINYKTLIYDSNIMGNPYGYIMMRDSQYYVFSVAFDDDVFEQILSTFKFTEPSAESLDSDKDGLSDIDEDKYGTDKQNRDSDGDGYLDGEEVNNGYNPLGAGKMNQ